MNHKLLGVAAAVVLSGCASSPEKMQTAYASPLQYKDYSCAQIGGELERVSRRANELFGSLKTKADNDSTQMAVGMILFWPTLFFLEGGDGTESVEYSRLKGEREALEKVAIQKECDPKMMPKVVDVAKDGAPPKP